MAKKKKSKLPKSIAGVTIPKELRKGASFAALLESPVARRILADALIALAGVLAGNDRTRHAVAAAPGEAAGAVGHAAQGTAGAARGIAEVATDVVAHAAKALLAPTATAEGEGKRKRPDDEDDVVRHVSRRDGKGQGDKPNKH